MNFSKRTDWDLAPNRISELLTRLKNEGQKILDLTESNPTNCGFVYPQKEILTALLNQQNLIYAPSPQGMREAQLAVCEYYRQKQIQVDPVNVFLTASTSEAYSFLFRLLAEPGDEVLFPRPSYPLFQFLVELNDLEMGEYRLHYKDRWQLDEPSLRSAVNRWTKAIVLVNPNNPTGSSFTVTEKNEIQAICREQHLPLICDEVFLDYPFAPQAELASFLSCSDTLTFVLGGISKTLALPQMKISWIVLNGPEKLVQQAAVRLEIIADTYLSVNTPSQHALPNWLGLQSAIQQEVLCRVRRNRQSLGAILKSSSGCRCLDADGGWYAVIQLPKNLHEESLVMKLLEVDQVFAHPGYFFDFQEAPFLVVSLLVQPEIFDEGITRIFSRVAMS